MEKNPSNFSEAEIHSKYFGLLFVNKVNIPSKTFVPKLYAKSQKKNQAFIHNCKTEIFGFSEQAFSLFGFSLSFSMSPFERKYQVRNHKPI